MATPTREGTYRGEVISCDVEKKEGKCPQVVLLLSLDEEWDETAEEFRSIERVTTIAYQTLFNKDGKLNTYTVDSMCGAFGIGDTAALPQALRSKTPEGMKCQVVMQWNDWNGARNLRARFINHADATPGRKGAPAGDDVWADFAKAAGATSMPKPKEDEDAGLPF